MFMKNGNTKARSISPKTISNQKLRQKYLTDYPDTLSTVNTISRLRNVLL